MKYSQPEIKKQQISVNHNLNDINKSFKTTNINLLLNRVKIEKKIEFKKKIIFSISIIGIISFISFMAFSN